MIGASQSVKNSCLLELLMQAGSSTPLKAPELGLPETLLLQIQDLTNREMLKLANTYSSVIVDVTINLEQLEMLVGNIKQIEALTNGAIEFIKRDASTPLIRKVFGLASCEVVALKKACGIPTSKGGKPRCSIEERYDILSAWESCDSYDDRERYLQVSDKTKLSLRTIHMVIMQNEAEALQNSVNEKAKYQAVV